MILKSIRIKSFRNIEDAEIEFCSETNIVWGKNAQGKTSILEGIYIFARGKSFRTNKEAEFIKFDSPASELSVVYNDSARDCKMAVKYHKGEKRKMYFNGYEVSRATEFIGNFRAVLFCPDHLSIIKGSPSERRLFLDVALSQLNSRYVTSIKKYNALLSHRNALLKSGGDAPTAVFESLAQQLCVYAADITKYRAEYISGLGGYMSGYFSQMTGGDEEIEVSYISRAAQSVEEAEDTELMRRRFYAQLTQNIQRELYRKTSLYGTHRDDIEILLNKKSSRLFCSQGQQRSLILSMKLAEGDISRERSGQYPVYLFDDVLSELDSARAGFLLSRLEGKQVIITSCNKELFEKTQAGCLIYVEKGRTKCTFTQETAP